MRDMKQDELSREAAGVTLRPAQPDDEPFLFDVYASTRAEEFAMIPWSKEALDSFLKMQFTIQQRSYAAQYPDADNSIILADGKAVGIMRVSRGELEICLVDIALLPEYKGAGIGTHLLERLIAEAERAGKSVVLQVVKTNRAAHLYERMGFSIVGEDGVYYQMERRPG